MDRISYRKSQVTIVALSVLTGVLGSAKCHADQTNPEPAKQIALTPEDFVGVWEGDGVIVQFDRAIPYSSRAGKIFKVGTSAFSHYTIGSGDFELIIQKEDGGKLSGIFQLHKGIDPYKSSFQATLNNGILNLTTVLTIDDEQVENSFRLVAAKTITYSTTLLDPTSERLPPNYLGNDVIAISKSIEKIPAKDEFETSLAYHQRVLAAVGLTGKVSASSIFAVVVQTPPSFGKYDPDKQSMDISYLWGERPYLLRKNIEEAPLGKEQKSGQAHGYLLNPNRYFEYYDMRVNVTDLPPVTARAMKDSLRTLILFRVNQGFDERSFERPYRKIESTVVSIWLFDPKTGTVWLKRDMRP